MKLIPTELADVFVLGLAAHKDPRGFFVETWREDWGGKIRLDAPFIQDNHACSMERGVLRGLHFQAPPHSQAKLVWVVRGAVYDVVVDLRLGSPTYGRWHAEVLSAANMLRLYVPKGFAHGYLTLEPETEVVYKVNDYYAPGHEGGIRWDDPALSIAWPDISPVLSEKDKRLPLMAAFVSPFAYREK